MRQTFDYFTFTAPASPKVKEEPTVPKPAGTPGTAPAAAATSLGEQAAGCEVGHVCGNSVETVSTEIFSSAAALDQMEKVGARVYPLQSIRVRNGHRAVDLFSCFGRGCFSKECSTGGDQNGSVF